MYLGLRLGVSSREMVDYLLLATGSYLLFAVTVTSKIFAFYLRGHTYYLYVFSLSKKKFLGHPNHNKKKWDIQKVLFSIVGKKIFPYWIWFVSVDKHFTYHISHIMCCFEKRSGTTSCSRRYIFRSKDTFILSRF